MDTGSADLAAVRGLLERGHANAYVRALLECVDDGWQIHHAWAVVGPEPPPGWSVQTWRYERLAFVACVATGRELASLCSPDRSVIGFGGLQSSVPAARESAMWTHRPSFARHERLLLPWPVMEYRISAAETFRQLPQDMLVSDSCPSFPELQSAWRAFSEGDFSLSGAGAPPEELALIRIVDDRGWLGAVHVTPTQLTAEIHGADVAGAELELFGVTDRGKHRVDGPGTAVFLLQNGLPEHAWLWLKRGMAWLDYRSVDAQSGWTGELARAGVTIEAPSDPQANVEALLAAGEGPQVEFKRQLPADAEQKRKQFKTVAAFANCDGGIMVFGMDPDELTVIGLGGEDPTKLRDRLYALIHRTVVPSPEVLVEYYQVDGKTILVLHVRQGPAPPYGLAVDKGSRDKPEFYVRRGSSTYPAQPGELREAARSRPALTEHTQAPPGRLRPFAHG